MPPVASSTLCTLVVVGNELVLIDTGFGTRDLTAPSTNMQTFLVLMRSWRDSAQTAHHQIQALGYHPEDVKNAVVTHNPI